MKNIIDYLENFGDRTFEEFPFNDIDSLILSQLSYFIFDDFVPMFKNHGHTKDMFFDDIKDDEEKIKKMVTPTLDTVLNKRFFHQLLLSYRFKNLRINYFKSLFDEKLEAQFAAMVFKLDYKINYIAFRGTDITILGWKEDFNMALLDEIPSQTEAVNYLNEIIPHLRGRIIVGGHSKGGNLARFGAIFCSHRFQRRIEVVYDHDGPGIQRIIADNPRYLRIKDRIFKTVPHDSIVGILLNHDSDYNVVKSNNIGILQHDPFNWYIDIKKGEFQFLNTAAYTSKVNDLAINQWINSLNAEQRKILVSRIFKVFVHANIKTVKEMNKFPLIKLYRMFMAIKGFTREEKEICFRAVINLAKLWLINFRMAAFPPKKNKSNEKEQKKNQLIPESKEA